MEKRNKDSTSSKFVGLLPVAFALLGFGIVTMNPAFLGGGAFFLIVALAHVKKGDREP